MANTVKFAALATDRSMGTAVMRVLRRPTILPGLGIAGLAVVAVAVLFATAGGLVAFHLWPDHRARGASSRIVLPAQNAEPVVLRAPPRPARAGVARPAAPAAAVTVQPDGTPARASITTPDLRAPVEPRRPPPPPPDPPADAPAAPPAAPLASVAEVVGDSTNGLERTLRTAVDNVARGIEPVSPPLAATVAQTGGTVGDTVAGAGRVLLALLGSPADP